MMAFVRRALDWLAPRACPDCEGGSGMIARGCKGKLETCRRCSGSGRAGSGHVPRYVIPRPVRKSGKRGPSNDER